MADVIIIPIGLAGLHSLRNKYESVVVTRIGSAMTGLAKIAQTALRSNTQGWSPSVNFTISGSFAQGQFTIGTDDLRYKWVDDGTRAHTIRARRAKVLRFTAGRTPKTSPGRFIIGSGNKFGATVFRVQVYNPGIRPRNISKRIQEVIEPQLQRAIDRAITETLG